MPAKEDSLILHNILKRKFSHHPLSLFLPLSLSETQFFQRHYDALLVRHKCFSSVLLFLDVSVILVLLTSVLSKLPFALLTDLEWFPFLFHCLQLLFFPSLLTVRSSQIHFLVFCSKTLFCRSYYPLFVLNLHPLINCS